MEDYKIVDGKRLRYGYTTGTCAAGAAKGAAALLFGEDCVSVEILTPAGKTARLRLEDIRRDETCGSCAVRKDAGDDPDITGGILVYASARFCPAGILIEGGEGVGRVSKPGLDQPVGASAINRVPRRMIQENVAEVCAKHGYSGGVAVRLRIPGGKALAERTFNPQLGVEGGLSILGTTGVVEPMSDAAMIGAIRAEFSVRRASGEKTALITPGNYGKTFLAGFKCETEKTALLPNPVKCGNFIGDAVDIALDFGFTRVLVAGHIGKLVKLVTGNFNTHSKYGDPRIMIFTAFTALTNPDLKAGDTLFAQLFDCATSEAAIDLLQKRGYWEAVLHRILAGIQTQLDRRIAVYVLSSQTEKKEEKEKVERKTADLEEKEIERKTADLEEKETERKTARAENIETAHAGKAEIGGVLFSSGLGLLGCTDGAVRILSGWRGV
ncbi:MAG: cobalt-precorrin-5B (C(1))-methyltransferase CbiD [Spirochaetaceae bacterium]|jgi:cobalt-precorrin-5B (C1)-methyltransferase|nr:cobalt-precorrin-5B (C(1))-methyltransferase CbiD [Spirochaetaceae bacterium]